MASNFFLPIIYNYYDNFPDLVNLPGNIATGASWLFPNLKKNISTKTLVEIYKVSQFQHAWDTYSEWLKGSQDSFNQTGFSIMDLFYWEERLGNWGTQIQIDKDIAQNDINPFNSRMLVETIRSVQPIYKIEMASYPVNRAIISRLWPECLDFPINPSLKTIFIEEWKFLDYWDYTIRFHSVKLSEKLFVFLLSSWQYSTFSSLGRCSGKLLKRIIISIPPKWHVYWLTRNPILSPIRIF